MNDLRGALIKYSRRCDPAGSETLRDRVVMELLDGGRRKAGAGRGWSSESATSPRIARGWAIALIAAVAVIAVISVPALLLGGGDSQPVDVVTTVRPENTVPPTTVATTTPAVTTTTPAVTTTGAATTQEPLEPPRIRWERIDGTGAFDLHDGLQGAFDWPPTPGQQIEAILAVPWCPGNSDCDDVVRYVAGGHIGVHDSEWDAAIWISDDGQSWTAVEGPGFAEEGGQRITALATDGRRLVAAGMSSMGMLRQSEPDSALVWYSDDLGSTWIEVEEGTLATGDGGMMDLAWTGDGFIGVGNGFWFSPDGEAWTLTADEEPPVLVRSLVGWETGWVAVGDARDGSSAAMWWSEDGQSWELMDTQRGTGSDDEAIAGALSVAAGQDGLVAVGFDGPGGPYRLRAPAAWRSETGSSWEMVPPIPWRDTTMVLYEPLEDVAWLDGWMFAVGNSWDQHARGRCFMLASPDDGQSWVQVPLDPNLFALEFSAASAVSPIHLVRSSGSGAGFAGIEVMQIPSGGGELGLAVVGSNGTRAAIWVGVLED
jgi:hypothetical protein